VVLVSEDGRRLDPADRVVVLTGFRPDLSFLSEMRLDLDPVLQAPRQLAAEIDPNLHSCGSVSPHGAAELAQPEPGLYLVGMKSYGRAPTFLALTGYEQVRSVVAELTGDHEAAARVELTLPDTGVCGGAGLFDDPEGASSGGCCGPAPAAGQKADNEHGQPLRRGNFNPAVKWAAIRDQLGVPDLHLHDLRHTGNTLAAQSGASLRDLMTRMGHDSPAAALIYQHSSRASDAAIAAALDARLRDRNRDQQAEHVSQIDGGARVGPGALGAGKGPGR
jgi:hypothetical protein